MQPTEQTPSTNTFFPILVLLGVTALVLIVLMSNAGTPSADSETTAEAASEATGEAIAQAASPTAEAVEIVATPADAADLATTVPTEATAEATAEAAAGAAAPTETPAPEASAEVVVGSAAGVPVAFDPTSAYNWACAGCHGAAGEGVAGIGPALVAGFDSSEIAIIDLLTDSRPPRSPESRFYHPYRGGYPPLNDAQIADLARYVQELLAQ